MKDIYGTHSVRIRRYFLSIRKTDRLNLFDMKHNPKWSYIFSELSYHNVYKEGNVIDLLKQLTANKRVFSISRPKRKVDRLLNYKSRKYGKYSMVGSS